MSSRPAQPQKLTRIDTPVPLRNTPVSPTAAARIGESSLPPIKDYPFVEDGDLQGFLEEQLLVDELDELAPWLWLVSTPNSKHIQSLHEQRVCGRTPVIVERARLHLLWDRDKIFIKPLPAYLLDETILGQIKLNPRLYRATRGYLRSWTYLLQNPTDLEVAIEARLLPGSINPKDSSTRKLQYSPEEIFKMLKPYRYVENDKVSRRYHWGQLRLGRINFYNKFARREFNYHDTHRHYGTYFGQFAAPFLFVFGTASVVLSAFQVALAVTMEGDGNGDVSEGARDPNRIWIYFARIAKWFSIISILVTALLITSLVVLFVLLVGRELLYAVGQKVQKAKNKAKAKAREKTGTANP